MCSCLLSSFSSFSIFVIFSSSFGILLSRQYVLHHLDKGGSRPSQGLDESRGLRHLQWTAEEVFYILRRGRTAPKKLWKMTPLSCPFWTVKYRVFRSVNGGSEHAEGVFSPTRPMKDDDGVFSKASMAGQRLGQVKSHGLLRSI